MLLSYDMVKEYLDSNYIMHKGELKNLYFDESGNVVGTADDKVISMFYENKTGNGISIYAAYVIKNLFVGKDEQQKIIDAMYIKRLCKNSNDIKIHNNFAIESFHNEELSGLSFGTVGSVVRGNKLHTHLINDEFDIEIFGRDEYLRREYNNLFGVYLLNLCTKYYTSDYDYSECYSYYQQIKEKLHNSDASELIKKYADQFLDERNHQTYDGLGYPLVREINSNEVRQENIKMIKKAI